MKVIKLYFVLVFVIIIQSIVFCDFPLLISDFKSQYLHKYHTKENMQDFYNFLKFVDKNTSKKQDIYFSLPGQYHQILANYYLYPRRIYVNPMDIMWTNTIVSYETIPNIIYILEGEKSRVNNIFWIRGGEGIEGIIMSKKDMRLARLDFLMSLEKWHKSGELVLEIYDNGKLLRKITNKKIVDTPYIYEGRYLIKNEEEKLSSAKFLVDPLIPLTGYKEYDYKLYFKGDPNEVIGLNQEIADGKVETKKLLYQNHPYYKIFKSYGLNKNIYNRG